MGRNPEINKNLTKNPFLLLDSRKIKCYNIPRTKEASDWKTISLYFEQLVYPEKMEDRLESFGSITMISGRHGKL